MKHQLLVSSSNFGNSNLRASLISSTSNNNNKHGSLNGSMIVINQI